MLIDRGALIVRRCVGLYRGVHRPSLDAVCPQGRAAAKLRGRYTAAIVDGDGVLEDLDEAVELLNGAIAIGLDAMELIVFDVPGENVSKTSLTVVAPPPAEGLKLLGWDVFEALEPWWSLLSTPPAKTEWELNENGLFGRRAEAARRAEEFNGNGLEDPVIVGRVWLYLGVS